MLFFLLLPCFLSVLLIYRTEAEYAFKCEIPVIPLKVENNYDPDG